MVQANAALEVTFGPGLSRYFSFYLFSKCCNPTLGSHRETPENKSIVKLFPGPSLGLNLPRRQRSCPCGCPATGPSPGFSDEGKGSRTGQAGHAHLQAGPLGAAQLLESLGPGRGKPAEAPAPGHPLLPGCSPNYDIRSGCCWVITPAPRLELESRVGITFQAIGF